MLLNHVVAEIDEAMETAKKLHFNAQPLYWVIPQRHREGESVEQAMATAPYVGFKIHPRIHDWDMSDSFIQNLFHEVCSYAKSHQQPVLIHTGEDMDNPQKFAPFFEAYPEVEFILAHCRPWQVALDLLERFPNLKGDSSFVPVEVQQKIKERGLSHRLLYGSDYPVGIPPEFNTPYSGTSCPRDYTIKLED